MRRVLGIGGGTVGIEWSDTRLDTFAPYLFAPWTVEHAEPEHRFLIEADGDGFLLHMPDGMVSCDNEYTVALELEYTLTMLAQKLMGGYVQVHGSVFGSPRGCVLVVGTHGIGKTTLALAAISRGLVALSDDICPVGHDLTHMLGFPRPFKATDFTWAMIPRPVPADCPVFRAMEDITYVFFHEPPGKYYAERLPLRHVILPVRRPGQTLVEDAGETEAMQMMLGQGFNYISRDTISVARDLISLLRTAPPLRLFYEDAFDAVDTLATLLA